MKNLKKMILDVQQDVINLRDADEHVCPYDQWQEYGDHANDPPACTCNNYDKVIDDLDDILKLLGNDV